MAFVVCRWRLTSLLPPCRGRRRLDTHHREQALEQRVVPGARCSAYGRLAEVGREWEWMSRKRHALGRGRIDLRHG
jgi:hypothetical protein